jgi:hypothetical protein
LTAATAVDIRTLHHHSGSDYVVVFGIGFEGIPMANHVQTASLLARWREVERQLDEVIPGTPEEEDLQAEAAALRQEVERLTRPNATDRPQTIQA